MPDRVDVRAPIQKRTVVRLRGITKAEDAGVARRASTPRPSRLPGPTWGTIRATFRHLGASLGARPRLGTLDPARDVVNTWLTDTFEAGPFPTQLQIRRYADEMRRRADGPAAPIRYAYSDRALPGYGYPIGAVDLVSGWNMSLGLARARRTGEPDDAPRAVRTYGIQHDAPYVSRMRTATEQLADWDQYEAEFARSGNLADPARWRARREEIERRQLERFDATSGRFALRDLTLRAEGLEPGLYVPSFAVGDQFFQWSPEDAATYRTELVRGALRTAVDAPLLATGRETSTRVDCMLVPRRHQVLFAWTAVYYNYIIFTVPFYTVEVNIGTYSDILPMGWAFVGAEDDFRNAAEMSRRIQQSARYGLALRQDAASAYTTPWSAKILVRRDDGQWAVRAGVRSRNDPCAFLDVSRGDGTTDRYEISRRTTVQGGQRLNYAPLATQEVNPYSPDGISVWGQSHPFGNL